MIPRFLKSGPFGARNTLRAVLALLAFSVFTSSEGAPPRPKKIIPEIQKLGSGELIPEAVLRQYDSRTIGENLAYRLYLQYEKADPNPAGSVPVNIMEDSTLYLRFPEEKVAEVLGKGFLNFFQTRETLGTPAMGFRVQAERRIIDVSFDKELEWKGNFLANQHSSVHFLRPKYGTISFSTKKSLGTKFEDTSQYGSLIAVMKDEVKLRTTLSPTDCLGIFSFNFDSFAKPEVPVDRRRKNQSTFYGSSIYVRDGIYFDAQIFGALNLSDVAYFAIAPGQVSEDTSKKLIGSGVPVRNYSITMEYDRENLVISDPYSMKEKCSVLLRKVNSAQKTLAP